LAGLAPPIFNMAPTRSGKHRHAKRTASARSVPAIPAKQSFADKLLQAAKKYKDSLFSKKSAKTSSHLDARALPDLDDTTVTEVLSNQIARHRCHKFRMGDLFKQTITRGILGPFHFDAATIKAILKTINLPLLIPRSGHFYLQAAIRIIKKTEQARRFVNPEEARRLVNLDSEDGDLGPLPPYLSVLYFILRFEAIEIQGTEGLATYELSDDTPSWSSIAYPVEDDQVTARRGIQIVAVAAAGRQGMIGVQPMQIGPEVADDQEVSEVRSIQIEEGAVVQAQQVEPTPPNQDIPLPASQEEYELDDTDEETGMIGIESGQEENRGIGLDLSM
jgi:hypothetical protein